MHGQALCTAIDIQIKYAHMHSKYTHIHTHTHTTHTRTHTQLLQHSYTDIYDCLRVVAVCRLLIKVNLEHNHGLPCQWLKTTDNVNSIY